MTRKLLKRKLCNILSWHNHIHSSEWKALDNASSDHDSLNSPTFLYFQFSHTWILKWIAVRNESMKRKILSRCFHLPQTGSFIIPPFIHRAFPLQHFLLLNTRQLVSQHYNRSASLQAKMQHKAAYEQKIKLSERSHFSLVCWFFHRASDTKKAFCGWKRWIISLLLDITFSSLWRSHPSFQLASEKKIYLNYSWQTN